MYLKRTIQNTVYHEGNYSYCSSEIHNFDPFIQFTTSGCNKINKNNNVYKPINLRLIYSCSIDSLLFFKNPYFRSKSIVYAHSYNQLIISVLWTGISAQSIYNLQFVVNLHFV